MEKQLRQAEGRKGGKAAKAQPGATVPNASSTDPNASSTDPASADTTTGEEDGTREGA